MNYIYEYLNEIEKGHIVVPETIKKAYAKLIPIIDGKDSRWTFNSLKGEKPIAFLERFCRNSKGKWAGDPLQLMLFQKAKLQTVYGIVSRDEGFRKFKDVFDMRARKNGKTTELAGLGCYAMVADGEKGAEVYSLATTRDQAKLTWNESRNMIDQSPALAKFLRNRSFDIYCKELMAIYKALGKNTDNFDGLNCSMANIDEIHAIKDRSIYDVIKQSQSAREQPLINMITTAGTVRGGLFDDMYEYSNNVINDIFEDDRFFALLYQLDKPTEWTDEKAWQKANPAIDIIKSREDLREKVKRALNDKNFQPDVKTKDFNIIGVTEKGWLDYNTIDNPKTFELPRDVHAIGGFDLSRTGDLTSFNTLYFNSRKNEIEVETMYWIPESKVKDNPKIPYAKWIERGLLRVCTGSIINYHDVARYVYEMSTERGIVYNWIYYDSYSAQYLIEEMAGLGYAKDVCLIPCFQGYKTLSVPMQEMEADIKLKRLNYNNNPITKWCLTNVELIKDRNGNYMPKKYDDKQDRKIDGMATILDSYVGLVEHKQEFINLCSNL